MRNSKIFFLLILSLFAISSCNILTSNHEEQLTQTETLLRGNSWTLSSYNVQNGSPGDGFSIASMFHFMPKNKFESILEGSNETSKWTYLRDQNLIILFDNQPWEQGAIKLSVDKISESELSLSWTNFGYNIKATYSRN